MKELRLNLPDAIYEKFKEVLCAIDFVEVIDSGVAKDSTPAYEVGYAERYQQSVIDLCNELIQQLSHYRENPKEVAAPFDWAKYKGALSPKSTKYLDDKLDQLRGEWQ